jgi:hypothetical protein
MKDALLTGRHLTDCQRRLYMGRERLNRPDIAVLLCFIPLPASYRRTWVTTD